MRQLYSYHDNVKNVAIILFFVPKTFLRHESRNKEQSIANKAEKKSHDFGGNRARAAGLIQRSITDPKSLRL